MRQIKKQISLVKYLMIWCAILVIVFSIMMAVIVNVMANQAIRLAVSTELNNQLRRAAAYVEETEGQIELPDEMENVDDIFYFVILDEKGNLLAGEYPDNYNIEDDNSGKTHFRKVRSGGQNYYVSDKKNLIRYRAEIDGDYTIRGLVNVKDISTVYEKIKFYSYIGIGVELLVMVIVGVLLHRQISRPLVHMCEKAEQISEDLNLSDRIEYEGHFYELKILIEAYNKLLARMEKVVSRQEQFNSDVSHELRTPITVVRAQCQLTREELANNKEIPLLETIEIIERQSDKMNHIVEQLLNLSRMDQERVELEFEEIDLVDVVESVCEDEENASEDQINFSYDLISTLVTADIGLITMAVRNLISNAVKYSPVGSKIQVSCGRREDGAFVQIRDFGCGIASKDLPRIFEHYYRVEESRNSNGFGLGLTLAMKIAKLHGGTIHVKSELGQGSEFTIILPDIK